MADEPSRAAQRAEFEQRAIDARHHGHFQQAATLFREAADRAIELQDRLNLQLREACCLLAMERHDEAVELAFTVADLARAEHHLPELVDALGMIADHYVRHERLAEATHALAEAAHVLDDLPTDAGIYLVLQNLAVTYTNCGFIQPALELYDRALRVAPTDLDRQFTYANLAASYHLAALADTDPERRRQLLADAMYAANAAIDPEGGGETMAVTSALAHRALMQADAGNFAAALADATTAYSTAIESGMREEQIVAMAAEAIALWRTRGGEQVLPVITRTLALAEAHGLVSYIGSLRAVQVEALWTLGRQDEARAALEQQLHEGTRRLAIERAARWEHVLLAVEHLRTEMMSLSDPLTGLPNRRHLSTFLPAALSEPDPVCVGVIDLDGFKRINEDFGYLQGDAVLQQVATLLERACRRGDAVVRLGGDEFVMVLRAASPGDARQVFERIRTTIATTTWQGVDPEVRLTASVGVASGSGSFDASRVLAEAAGALQEAKRAGRDRIAFR